MVSTCMVSGIGATLNDPSRYSLPHNTLYREVLEPLMDHDRMLLQILLLEFEMILHRSTFWASDVAHSWNRGWRCSGSFTLNLGRSWAFQTSAPESSQDEEMIAKRNFSA